VVQLTGTNHLFAKYKKKIKQYEMKRFNKIPLLLLVLIVLTPATAWAGDPSPKDDASFPKPYRAVDKGVDETGLEFTLRESNVLPGWLSFAVQHRTRYETLDSQFRSGTTGSDQVLSLRTMAQATFRLGPSVRMQLEFQDSRAYLADTGTKTSTGGVNAAELLEANLQWLAKGLFQEGSRSLLRGGRFTMDIGKRRLVARNNFRNTKNAFTGVDWIWKAKNGTTARALLTLPVRRRPTSSESILDNEVALDDESLDSIFWGVFFATPNLPWGDRGEFYLFGLHEDDDPPNFATANRDLYTPGFRFYRPKEKGKIDYEWESILQFGTSRATTAESDTRDLDHFAHFHHVEVGYSFSAAWSPRLTFEYDYASGDDDPNDGTNDRFDPLFGGASFDYGPTSIHRAFIRSNITGPGVKFSIRPHEHVSTYIHYRAFWLASKTDVWAGNSELQDPTGNSGSFLGQQLFWVVNWKVLANVFLEGGVAYRIDGDFQDTAPGATGEGNTLYSFASVTLSF
jgi:Alginate export